MSLSPVEKYLYKPYKGSSHSWALAKCAEYPKDLSVLDVGCGSGAVGEALRGLGYSSLDAVEVDAAAREHARPIYGSVFSKIDDVRKTDYRLVLLMDVIEHVTDPKQFLETVAAHTDTNGRILISVPNIAHWSLRISLLFGFFEYTKRGLLDQTHYSFFTRRRIRSLVNTIPGLSIISEHSSIEPLELLLPRAIWDNKFFEFCSDIRITAAEMLPGLMAYQHLIEVRKG